MELFGAGATLYVAGACATAFLMVGHRSVYPGQHLAYSKSAWLVALPDTPVGLEKIQLSWGLLRWWSERLRAFKRWRQHDSASGD